MMNVKAAVQLLYLITITIISDTISVIITLNVQIYKLLYELRHHYNYIAWHNKYSENNKGIIGDDMGTNS